jgi:glutathione synthase/RimK-type ligase-like ATP-grasp enzyme
MNKNILIIGNEKDPHISTVISYLKEAKANIMVINPVNGNIGNIAYSYSPFDLNFIDADKTFNYSEVNAVWWRLKSHMRKYPESVEDFETNNFISNEWQFALAPLSYFLNNCYWLNKRNSDLILRNKPYQLFQASINGFKIPDTIISNNYNLIKKTTDDFTEIMYKSLGTFSSPYSKKILYSNKINREFLNNCEENIKIAPGIFQNYVDKDYELRITVVDKEIYAVKIFSQEDELSKLDWRRGQTHLKYELIKLDEAFEQKLLKFHKTLDIVFGGYDFIVDKNGEYTFLEVNQVGQWLWLENRLNLDISKQIASTLLNNC